ncbi:hypothetical protein [Thiomicrorhabdus sp. Kp2]|uniref:hypothetical protein n=1 Tax=Thiomicrorhabdus sp. Kp2 TaxID=1123518 RepID=UPI000594F1A2|nr:hypothetical protein [Thiomicrorhabdus sp. Kp2]
MSGSGSDGFVSTGTGNTRVGRGISEGDVNDDSCSSFEYETTVGSPDPSMLSSISAGDVFTVDLIQSVPGFAVVQLTNSSKQRIGGLTPSAEVEFITQCIMKKNTMYQAIVLQISGSLIKILVKSI